MEFHQLLANSEIDNLSIFGKVFARTHFYNYCKLESKTTDFSVDFFCELFLIKTTLAVKLLWILKNCNAVLATKFP